MHICEYLWLFVRIDANVDENFCESIAYVCKAV